MPNLPQAGGRVLRSISGEFGAPAIAQESTLGRGTAVLPASSIVTGLAIGSLMVFGSWLGKRVVERLPERVFLLLIEGVMTVAELLFLVRDRESFRRQRRGQLRAF